MKAKAHGRTSPLRAIPLIATGALLLLSVVTASAVMRPQFPARTLPPYNRGSMIIIGSDSVRQLPAAPRVAIK